MKYPFWVPLWLLENDQYVYMWTLVLKENLVGSGLQFQNLHIKIGKMQLIVLQRGTGAFQDSRHS